jgi:hypothetical protein
VYNIISYLRIVIDTDDVSLVDADKIIEEKFNIIDDNGDDFTVNITLPDFQRKS